MEKRDEAQAFSIGSQIIERVGEEFLTLEAEEYYTCGQSQPNTPAVSNA